MSVGIQDWTSPTSTPWPRQRWEAACASLRVARPRDNTPVYRQGEPCTHLYLVARGHVKLSRLTPEGEARVLALLPAGEICGAPLTSAPPGLALETATAKGKVELYQMPASELRRALAHDAELALYIVERLAERRQFLEARIEHLLDKDIQRRVAATLLELASRYGGRCAHGHEVDVRLTQQELAELVGASRPVVSTVLNELRAQGLVSYTRAYICLDDVALLARASG